MQKGYKFTLNERDHYLAQKVNMRPRPVFRGLIWIVSFLWLIATALSISDTGFFDGISLYLVIFGTYIFILIFLILPYRWKRNFRKSKILQKEQHYFFGDDGLSAESENGSGNIKWSDFLEWKKGKEIFLLYPAPNLFYLIPKRIFSSESEFEEVSKLLTDKIGKPKV